MPYETYVNLIRQLDDLIAVFEHHSDPTTREQAGALLIGLDQLHREGLTRLVAALRDADALDRAIGDPVVETLLGLYDLVDLNLPEAPQPELDPSVSFIPLERLRSSSTGNRKG